MRESAAIATSGEFGLGGLGPVGRSLLERPADEVAPSLLGLVLARRTAQGEVLAGRIVEAEAYLGPEDLASHARDGRRTARNEMMYARPGTCYVYFTYGMHFMCNVACLREGHPAAVLIRALEPIAGIEAMRRNRGDAAGVRLRERDLCSGPGKLCQALGISADLNGADMVRGSDVRLLRAWGNPGGGADLSRVGRSARIGVDAAGDWAAAPLRWFVAGSPHVSRGRPSGASGPAGGPNRKDVAGERKE